MAALTIPADKLEYVIRYAKLEDVVAENSDEKPLIQSICLANMIYLEGAPVKETDDNSALYWFLVAAMTLHSYDHRDEIGFVPEGVRPVLNQLKLQTDYADSE